MVSILSFSGGLGTHVRYHHSDTTTWPCSHCPQQFQYHQHLYMHMYRYHWEGQFECGIDGCKFDKVATHRSVIINHQSSAHRSTIYTCDIDQDSPSPKSPTNAPWSQAVPMQMDRVWLCFNQSVRCSRAYPNEALSLSQNHEAATSSGHRGQLRSTRLSARRHRTSWAKQGSFQVRNC